MNKVIKGTGGAAIAREKGLKALLVYMHPDEKKTIRIASAVTGVAMSSFVRDCAMRTAERVLKEKQVNISSHD